MSLLNAYGKISFIYFDDLKAACDFFEGVLQLPLVCDQKWSKIYQICPGSYLGAVDRSRGACKATTRDGVLTSFVVLNFEDMVTRLEKAGIEFSNPPHLSEALQIKSLMFIGPEGYKFEVEEFLNPADRAVFYPHEKHED
jgi:predicted enzyme related to lactoylglutathione lyase